MLKRKATHRAPPTKKRRKTKQTVVVEEDDGKEEFVVEKILDMKVDKQKKKYFFVKWQDWEDVHNSWEPEENMTGCRDLVDEFMLWHVEPQVALEKAPLMPKSDQNKNTDSSLISKKNLKKDSTFHFRICKQGKEATYTLNLESLVEEINDFILMDNLEGKKIKKFLTVVVDENSQFYCLVKFTDSDFVQVVSAAYFLRCYPELFPNFSKYFERMTQSKKCLE